MTINVQYGDQKFNLNLPSTLETARVQLIPFDLAAHGSIFFNSIAADIENITRWLPISFPTYEAFIKFYEDFMQTNDDSVLFAILDKTKSNYLEDLAGSIAGIIGYLHSSPGNRSLEIGPVIISPAFQRTFVATNAIAILLKAILDLPEEGGLGFRRVAWSAHPENAASIKAAERMGFRKEGVQRWTWCLPEDKQGKRTRPERGTAPARDSLILALCWDDWEDIVKEKVEHLINRM